MGEEGRRQGLGDTDDLNTRNIGAAWSVDDMNEELGYVQDFNLVITWLR